MKIFWTALFLCLLNCPYQTGVAQGKAKNAKAKSRAQTPPPTKPPLVPVEAATLPEGMKQFDLYLLLGQSNMKGRGVMPEIPLADPQIINFLLKTDAWFLARHPLHLKGDPQTFKGHDNAGVGPGLAFAQELAKQYPQSRVGLVPCAVGGSRIQLWKKGGPLYKSALRRAKLAVASGPAGKTKIRGAIWLQGEADARPEKIETYSATLAQMIKDLRADVEVDDLPFIACTIGEMREQSDLQKKMNLILLDLPQRVTNTGCVDARELKSHIGDSVHFDTAAQEEMGRRFAKEFFRISGE